MKKLLTIAAVAVIAPLAAFAESAPGAHFLENWDLDGNGSVSLAELEERRADVFVMFDQDENSLLDAKEYVLFDETRAADMKNNADSHGKGGGRMQKGLTLEFNDNNNDGKVSKQEFVSNTAAWLSDVDRNGDGMITTADFGPKS